MMQIYAAVLLLLLSCTPNTLEITEVFDNNAPKEAYSISSNGEKQTKYSWYRNGIKAEEMPLANGVPHGDYRKWSTTGFIMESGKYKDSLREGKWTFFAKEKIPFMQGYYKKGLKHGNWTTLDDNGKIIEENSCHAANETGYFKSYTSEGKISIYQECKNGILNGVFMSYYPGSSLQKIGHFENGLKNGLWVEYFANGKLRKIEHWIASIRNGDWMRLNENGDVMAKTEFIDGTGVFEDTSWQNNRIQGEIRTSLKNGEYLRIDTYENGIKQSTADYLASSNKLLAFGFWKNGKREGAWQTWYRSGVLKDSLNYTNGNLIGNQFHYDSTGRLYKKETTFGNGIPAVVEMFR